LADSAADGDALASLLDGWSGDFPQAARNIPANAKNTMAEAKRRFI
jgi:hypothetical protein